MCLTPWCAKVQLCPYTTSCYHEPANWEPANLQYRNLSWPHITFCTHDQHSSSSCKGKAGLLHIMGSNTMIFAVLKAWLMSPLHCVINWEVFYIDPRLSTLFISAKRQKLFYKCANVLLSKMLVTKTMIMMMMMMVVVMMVVMMVKILCFACAQLIPVRAA